MRLNAIRRALVSVTDKRGIVEFARDLSNFGVEIISTGGTASLLKKNNIPVVEVSAYTGFPEMMDGRLKTLHPKILGGLLAIREREDHLKQMADFGIGAIDLIAVNLYRFEDTVARRHCTLEEAIENIDIGGPTMLRAAAKNFRHVTVLCDPDDYSLVTAEMKERDGKISEATNFALAKKVFELTARYDGAIANYLGTLTWGSEERKVFPDTLNFQFSRDMELRYGENPHQRAAFYRENIFDLSAVANARKLQGKELSYNNIMDADAAWRLVGEFDRPCCVIVKHANPCGVASAEEISTAFTAALKTDPVSAFGGIVALNRSVDEKTAAELMEIFLEIVIAPEFTEDALALLEKRPNLRLLEISRALSGKSAGFDLRRVMGGLLVQDWDDRETDVRMAKVVTKRTPTQEEYRALDFAWRVVKHVKSNAIVFARDGQLVGVGAGQMSRVDAVRIARMKANLPTAGCVMASDAFFPFRDGIDLAAEAGITAVIQPGESLRDEEVIRAADEHGMAMVFTGIRHFKH